MSAARRGRLASALAGFRAGLVGPVGFAAFAGLAPLACAPESRHGAEPAIELGADGVLELLPGPTPLLRAVVEGHPDLVFAVDSGAAVTMIDATSAKALGLAVRPHVGAWSTKGSDGEHWAMNEYADLACVEFGALVLRDVHVQVLDIASARSDGWFGILGMDVLSHFALVFDVARHQLHVLPPDSTQASISAYLGEHDVGEGEWGLVPLEGMPGKPSLTMTVKEQDYGLTIDTGSSGTSFPKPALSALGSQPVGTYEARTVGGVLTGSAYRVDRLQWFGFVISADVMDTDLPYGLLGMNVLGEFVFVLDGPGQRLWLHRRQPTEPEPAH